MTRISSDAPSINANFAATVINRAAEIVAGTTTSAAQECDAFSALQQARDEFLAAETHKQKGDRTYGWGLLLRDVREYIKSHEPAYAGSFTPLVDWSAATDAGVVAQTLREAALAISRMVAERSKWVVKLEAMTEIERTEFELMWKAVQFLQEHGLTVQVAWDREDTNDPIDYWATANGVAWAFELTELRLDPEENYHRKVGHPKDKRSIAEQLDMLAIPLPQIPEGPDALQTALNDAITHGSKPSKLTALNGAKYCLVLHNQQFLYAPDWEAITMPDISAFDAVLVLHQEIYPLVETWEVMQNGFDKMLRSHDVNDLSDIIAFKNSTRTRRNDPDRVKAALQRIQALNLTEDDVLAAIAETRAERRANDAAGIGH